MTKSFAFAVLLAFAVNLSALAASPNIVFFLCDDLGFGDVGHPGMQKPKTPNLDRLARDGMRLTRCYSGHNVCAPSRCVLMSGMHPGHAYIRDNLGGLDGKEGQEPVPKDYLSLPLLFKQAGYTVGGFGKWGLGPVGSSGDPLEQGFDRFFGYNCQAVAHNHYPTYLWDGDKKFPLDNPAFDAHQKFPAKADPKDLAAYARYRGKQYAPDVIHKQVLAFIRENKNRPFFLYVPCTLPHVALQVPEPSRDGLTTWMDEGPYLGDRGYLPHPRPRAAYAEMVGHIDRQVGSLWGAVEAAGLERNTIFVFTSDNGPAEDGTGGSDSKYFDSTGGLRGRKGSYYEGGVRVPCIVCWPGKIAKESVSDRMIGFEDWLPTLLELAGQSKLIPKDVDGISMAPTLLGKYYQSPRKFLYRESPGYGGQQMVIWGEWKGIRRNLNPPKSDAKPKYGAWELYNLTNDPNETNDLAQGGELILEEITKIAEREHVKSELFPIRAID